MELVRKYFWVAHLLVIVLCAYFLAQTVATYVGTMLGEGFDVGAARDSSEAGSKPDSLLAEQELYTVIADRNIFNSVDEAIDAPPEGEQDPNQLQANLDGPAEKTNLNIKVLSTLVAGDGKDRRSSTVVQGGKSTKPAVYFASDQETFEDGVLLVQIKKDRIEFINKGRLEYAMLEGMFEEFTIFKTAEEVHGTGEKVEGSPVAAAASPPLASGTTDAAGITEGTEGSFVIDQREVDEALTNLDQLYTQIRIVPNPQGGMKVVAVKPGSIFSRLGLRRGDVLEKINGIELTIESSMQLFAKLKDQKNLKIDLIRRGQNKTLEYEIR